MLDWVVECVKSKKPTGVGFSEYVNHLFGFCFQFGNQSGYTTAIDGIFKLPAVGIGHFNTANGHIIDAPST